MLLFSSLYFANFILILITDMIRYSGPARAADIMQKANYHLPV